MEKIKDPKKWYIRLFTIGEVFNPKTFIDNLKKYSFEFLGFFLVVTFSFYTESSGTDFEMRNNYLNISKSLSVEMSDLLDYTQEYLDQNIWATEVYQEQYERWDQDIDSVFISFEPDEEFHYSPMAYYTNRDAFNPPKNTFEIFNKGTQDFFMVNQEISALILSLFVGTDLKYLNINTDEGEKEFIDEYNDRLSTKWFSELKDYEDIDSDQFWIKNRKYIQNDRYIKHNLFKRIELWMQIRDQLDDYLITAQKDLNALNENIGKMEAERYFIYWKIPF